MQLSSFPIEGLPSLSNRLHAERHSLVSLLGRCAVWCIGNALHVFSQLVVLRLSSSVVTAALLRRQHVRLFVRGTCHTQVSHSCARRPHAVTRSPTPRQLPVGSTAPTKPRLRRWTRCAKPFYSLWAPRATNAPPRVTHAESACTFCGGTQAHQSSAYVVHAVMGPPCSHPWQSCPPPHSSRQSILCQTPWTLADSFSRNPPTARALSTTHHRLSRTAVQSAETIVRIPNPHAPTTGAPSQGCTAALDARARRTAPLRVRKCTGSREATSKPARR
jgi:hypothetical protein